MEEDKRKRELEILLRDTWVKEDPIAIREVDPERLGLLMVGTISLYLSNRRDAEVIGAPVPSMLIKKLPTGLYQLEGVVVAEISEKEQEYGFFRRRTRPREECIRAYIPTSGYLLRFNGPPETVGVGVFRRTVGPYESVIPVYAPLPYDVFAHCHHRKDI